jgi:putative transposase
LEVDGLYEIPLVTEGQQVKHPFFVVKGLSEPMIVGIDLIQKHGIRYCPVQRTFSTTDQGHWQTGHLKVRQETKIPPFSVRQVKTRVVTDAGGSPSSAHTCLVHVTANDLPLITGGPALLQTDGQGVCLIEVTNCGPLEVELQRNDFVGHVENISTCEIRELNPGYINAVAAQNVPPKEKLTAEKIDFIDRILKQNVPSEFVDDYKKIILRHHDVISRDKFDLGRTNTLLHEISLKTDEPIYVKQFKIPEAHRAEVEKHVAEWLKLGVVQPSRSKYNSPIFVVAKKNGGLRLVQDFRALNAQTHIDKYSMLDVTECIAEIGRSGSGIFTTIDLTGGFWQMLLHPKSRPYTAFTVPGQGQYQWVTSPMGLLGCPASFQRLMETVVKGIPNVLVYIDDLLLHSEDHPTHLQLLDQLLNRLSIHGVKINLEKCVFASHSVSYLGFELTEEGVKPGHDKLRVVREAQPPTSVRGVRQFLGLCNFFRAHVRNFAQVSAPLTALTQKDCKWKNGDLPDAALKAFRELQSILCSEPVVSYPRKDRPYALITDAALGDSANPGGLGAILTQINPQGEHHVLGYASRKLQKHEANYTPFLLEMQAAIWGMEHFSTYLKGRHFILFTDHRPLEKLGKVHTRTLNRLQEAMNSYDFEIIYKKGSEMPADFLSRNVTALSWESRELVREQEKDPLARAIKKYLLNRELPDDEKCRALVKLLIDDCFIEDDVLWRRIHRRDQPDRVVMFLPRSQIESVLKDAHGHLMTGHDGLLKTKERIAQCYYWPGMDKDIQEHLQTCHKCQLRKTADRPPPTLLTPLPQPTEPNQRVHADLFGPLKTSGQNKKFILCVTDAFTKYVELVALPNKEATTVSTAIFEKWICRYSVPLEIITDQGKEFCNQLAENLYKKLRLSHHHTSSHHPACNSQAEVANKTIAKYLASFVQTDTLDWEDYIAPLMFCYNTSFHRSIQNSPHFLTFGMEARLPTFMSSDLRRKFYGESSTDELIQRLLHARDIARRHNELQTEEYRGQYDKKAEAHSYQLRQLVLLDEHSFLHKNTKLAPKWSGPHRVIQIKGETNVELLLRNGKRLIVHTNRLKPYLVPKQYLENEFPKEIVDNPSVEITPSDVEISPRPGVEISKRSRRNRTAHEDIDPRMRAEFPEVPIAVPLTTRPTVPDPVISGTPKKRGRPPKRSTMGPTPVQSLSSPSVHRYPL